MEKPPRGTGGRVGVSSRAKNVENSPPPLPWPHSRLRLAPGPRVLAPARDPAGSRPRSLPRQRRGPGAGAPRPQPPHPESKLARRGDAPWRRAAVRSGEGGTRHEHSPGRSVGWLADLRDPRRGTAPALPSRRRTRRAAAEGALPPRRGGRASSIARHPSSRVAARDGEQLRAASRGFKDNNKKMATTQLLLRTPSPKVPSRPGEQGRGVEGATLELRAGVWAALHLQAKHNSARRGDAGNPPAPGKPRAPPPTSPGVWSAGTSCSGRESSKPI